MRSSRRLRSATASWLVVLLGALGTGLPSHHHEDPSAPADRETAALHAADHHAHGTQLVEQDGRTPSTSVQFAAPAPVADAPLPDAVVLEHPTHRFVLRPMERGPPPGGGPRAPPFPA